MKLQKKHSYSHKDKGNLCLFRPIALSLFMFASINTYAQTGKVSVNTKNAPLKEFFLNIEKQTSYRFSYRDADIKNKETITVAAQKEELKTLLMRELAQRGLTYKMSGNKIVIIPISKNQNRQKITVTGNVKDANGNPLIGVTVMSLTDKSIGGITNLDGEFAISGIPVNEQLLVSYIGY